MALMERISDALAMPAPKPRHLRVVAEAAPVTPEANRQALAEFIGQRQAVFNLSVEIAAAELDGKLPAHILLEGPAGLGKTTMARLIADRLGIRFVEIPATALTKVNDVARALEKIGEPADGPCAVFVDEIHGTCAKGELLLLSALQEGWIQPSGVDRLTLAPFVMIGATTNPGALTRPLRERFGIREALDFYAEAELAQVIAANAVEHGIGLEDGVADILATVGRGTPRVANALLRRVAAFSRVAGSDAVTGDDLLEALDHLGVDDYGLEPLDRRIMTVLAGQSGAVGIDALGAQLGLDNDAITSREPYMLRCGAIRRTGRGRVLTRAGYRMLGMNPVWVP